MSLLGKIFRRTKKGDGEVTRKRAKQLARLNPDVVAMPEPKFWKIISSSAKKKKALKQWELTLEKKLSKLKLEDLLAFQLRVDDLLIRSYHEDLLCACAIVEGTTEDTSFDGFRCWLVMHGKDVFYRSVQDPDSIVSLIADGVEDHYFPSLLDIAVRLFLKQSGKSLTEASNYSSALNYPELMLNWSLADQDSMRAVCPGLWNHVHGGM
jgi:hypothetical protein